MPRTATMKLCSLDRLYWPFDRFPRNSKGSLMAACRDCSRRRARQWTADNSEQVRTRQRWYRLRKKYGLTKEGYDWLFAQQNGVCAICRKPAKNYSLSVDHDHETGVVRGLLCVTCNYLVGLIEGRPDVYDAVQRYLLR